MVPATESVTPESPAVDPQAIAEHTAIVIPDGREAVDDTGSLSDHEAQYSGRPQPLPTDEEPPARPARHRAKSQTASAGDYEEIASLTKTLREKEAALAKAKPDAVTGSSRVLNLRRQIKAIEAELSDLQPKATPEPTRAQPQPAAPQNAPAPVVAAPSTFTEREPKLEDFASADDPYSEWNVAKALYRFKKEQHAAEQTRLEEQRQRAAVEARAVVERDMADFGQRVAAYAQTKPDFAQKYQGMVAEIGVNIPPALGFTLAKTLDKGPAFLDLMVSDPDFRDDVLAMSEDKPITDALVARLRRRFEKQLSRVSAGTTGAATTPVQPKPLPPPPTPVRTGSLSGGTQPPGDGASLSEHESFYHRKRR